MSAICYSLTAKTLIFRSSFEIGIKVMPGRVSTLQRRQQTFPGVRTSPLSTGARESCVLSTAAWEMLLEDSIWAHSFGIDLSLFAFISKELKNLNLVPQHVLWCKPARMPENAFWKHWSLGDEGAETTGVQSNILQLLWQDHQGWGRDADVGGSPEYALSFQRKWEEVPGFPSGKW